MEDTPKDDPAIKSYEVSFLTESEDKIEDVKRLVDQHGASISQELPPKKINLSYPVRRATQALLVALNVLAEPEKIKTLERDLKSSKDVLRSLIVALPREKDASREQTRKTSLMTRRASGVQREVKAMPLSNEAIEKKIEEILQ